MDASQSRRALIAIDANVLLDLAEESEDVTDAVMLIRRRLHQAQFLMLPTVREELADEVRRGEDFEKRSVLNELSNWREAGTFNPSTWSKPSMTSPAVWAADCAKSACCRKRKSTTD